MDDKLDAEDPQTGNYVEALDPGLQYPGPKKRSQRHRVWNNLPGNRDFCPLIHRTEKLERFSAEELKKKVTDTIGKVHPDLLSRAAAFLPLQAEFLYECVEETVPKTLPEEVQYLECHDEMRNFIQKRFDMPDKQMENLIGFLRQNSGKLSKRALNKKFEALNDDEVRLLENKYQEIFTDIS